MIKKVSPAVRDSDEPASVPNACGPVVPSPESKLSRREMVKCSLATVTACLASPQLNLLAQSTSQDGFPASSVRESLGMLMEGLVKQAQCKIRGVTFTGPCASPSYRGVWPDDCVWPYIAEPQLAKEIDWTSLLEWLSEKTSGLDCVPDRVEFSGVAVPSPGPAGHPLSERMPLHLPSAWTRYLDSVESFGVAIPQKDQWAALIQRSFEKVPFSNGLVYSDPALRVVGFGFHDSVRITGEDLMTSLITYRGMQRASKLFAGQLPKAVSDEWQAKAEEIRKNLDRLYDENAGGFVGGSLQGRQFSVWANGLIYPLATKEQRQRIIQTILESKESIFLKGCTRQVIEPGGWNPGPNPCFTYQRGGFWATGTGFILPALVDGAPALAKELSRDLLANLAETSYAEWLDQSGKPQGARNFLASLSVPLIALRALTEKRPMLEYF